MDPEIFIPSIKDPQLITDAVLMNEVINSYLDEKYEEMKGFILEYGEENFFQDLDKYFSRGYWKCKANQYIMFAGITIAFFKIYNKPSKMNEENDR